MEGRAAKALEGFQGNIAAFEEFAAKRGETPAEIALTWLLHQPAVTAPSIGPRTSEQLAQALKSLDVTLDTDAMARLNQIFPGPKTAPEDYAW